MQDDFGTQFKELVRRARSIRRFHEEDPVPAAQLRDLVDCARLVPSSGNRQPLRYIICNEPARRAEVFTCLQWAGYLADWPGPGPGERPPAYIVIVADTAVAVDPWCDCGIAAQTMALYAAAQGLGMCMLGAIDCERLLKIFGLSPQYQVLLVLAVGRPKEKVVLTATDPEHGIRYWRDGSGVHFVPKRPLKEVLIKEFVEK